MEDLGVPWSSEGGLELSFLGAGTLKRDDGYDMLFR